MNRIIFIVVFLVSISFGAAAQCGEQNITFKGGERVTYHAYYNWGFIWINAGIVTFKAEDTTYGDKPAYFLSSNGSTYKSYDFLYKVRDTFEVFVDTLNLRPFEFNRVTKEGSTVSHHHYVFDKESETIRTSISKDGGPFKNSVITWKDCSYDVLSMVYKARNIDFEKYNVGDKIPISLILDGKIYDLYIRYKGKEILKNRDGRKYRCLKFSPLLVDGTIFSSGEDMTVWVTDDRNRVPIIVEAKILIGSVKAVFVRAEGLRYPMEAEIKR